MLYGSAKIELHDLTDTVKSALLQLCGKSRDLYNVCTAAICRQYEERQTMMNYQALKAAVGGSAAYKALGGYFFQVLLSAISDFKKYLSTDSYILRKSDRTLQVKNLDSFVLPHPKSGLRPIEVKRPLVRDGKLLLLSTPTTPTLYLGLPTEYQDRGITRAVIKPLYHTRTWELIIEYEVREVAHKLDPDKALGIDLGITNLATCVSTDGDSFIIDGRRLKSILQGYCKYRAKLLRASHGSSDTRRLCSLSRKTHNRSLDYARKSAAYIVSFCITHGIGKIVLGWGVHFQQANLGQNNQLYALFPFAKLKDMLSFQCQKHGITLVIVDESYTSQASAYDLDPIPEHIQRQAVAFSGKRIHRGLYMSGDGITLNADVNGAINILRKGNVNPSFLRRSDGRGLASPHRIDPLTANPMK